MRFLKTAGLLATLALSAAVLSPLSAASLAEVAASARHRDKVVTRGKVTRQLTLDRFVLAEGSTELLLSLEDVRHRLQRGDEVVVFARFLHPPASYPHFPGELEAIDYALAADPKASVLLEKQGRTSPSAASPRRAASDADESVETRLEVLESLRKKKLISEDEYHRHRARILETL